VLSIFLQIPVMVAFFVGFASWVRDRNSAWAFWLWLTTAIVFFGCHCFRWYVKRWFRRRWPIESRRSQDLRGAG
jgi:hypothetical protein